MGVLVDIIGKYEGERKQRKMSLDEFKKFEKSG